MIGPIEAEDVVVILPTVLIRLFPGCDPNQVVFATNVREMIDALDARWPGMRDRLCEPTPRIRRHINIFVDGERATLKTPVSSGKEVLVMTAISGG